MLPDPRFYEDCLRASFAELREATVPALDAATDDALGRQRMRAAFPSEAG